ncbi:MAG TPA: hypothetical protein VGF75_01475 [Candidatus Saccharimonadales bacterium]|jgi:hypothetical protein
MKSQQFQFASYSPAEFEQFRAAVMQDGFQVTQSTIDTVSGHIGSLTYLTGAYNRNQQLLTVTIKTSPWQTFQDADVEGNVLRVTSRQKKEAAAVNTTAVKSAVPTAGTGQSIPPKAIVQPAPKLPVTSPAVTPATLQPAVPIVPKPAQTPVPTQTPKPADPVKTEEVKPVEAAKPAEAAPATPTESK